MLQSREQRVQPLQREQIWAAWERMFLGRLTASARESLVSISNDMVMMTMSGQEVARGVQQSVIQFVELWSAWPHSGCSRIVRTTRKFTHRTCKRNKWWQVFFPIFYGLSLLCGDQHPTVRRLTSHHSNWLHAAVADARSRCWWCDGSLAKFML